MIFWIFSILLALLVSGLLILVLMRGRRQADGEEPAAAYDLQVYRDQLRDIDRDLARGVIGQEDAERVRVEVSRRILAADARVQMAGTRLDQPRKPALVTGAVLAVLVIGGSALLYGGLGSPGHGDLGLQQRIELAEETRQTRPGQQQVEAQMPPAPPVETSADYRALIEQLRETVAARPDDLQGQVLLAHHEAQSGDFVAAHAAQAQVIRIMGDTAGAREYAEYGELLIVAAGGYVSPEAEGALRSALELDPVNGPSRYYWGLMLAQIGRPDLAFRIWEETLRQSPPDAPWLEPIRAQIGEMAWLAGVEYTLPTRQPAAPPLAGPSAEDVATASEMSPEERQAMIRAMVDGLSERLATSGGKPAEWARLISALGVLGDTDRAQSAYDEARTVFAADDPALAEIAAAAARAGLSE